MKKNQDEKGPIDLFKNLNVTFKEAGVGEIATRTDMVIEGIKKKYQRKDNPSGQNIKPVF